MSKKKKEWRAEKERLLSLGLEDRRKEYVCNHVTLDKIATWRRHDKSAGIQYRAITMFKEVQRWLGISKRSEEPAPEEEEDHPVSLCDKVSLYKGDITILEVDAIVNAANSSLLGGGGVDGCIHRAAGHFLYDECQSLNGCDTGKAKITCGYNLPAKYVIHTVGPIARGNVGPSQSDDLRSCYENSLKLMKDNKLRSVAFPCISTGIYGFPNEPAAVIAMQTVKQWLMENKDEIDRVIFCVFLETDYEIYKGKMPDYFTPDDKENKDVGATQLENESKEELSGDVEMESQVQDDQDMEDVGTQSQKSENDTATDENQEDGNKMAPEGNDQDEDPMPAGEDKTEEEKEKLEPKKGETEAAVDREPGGEDKTESAPADAKAEQENDPANTLDTKEQASQGEPEPMDDKDDGGGDKNEPVAANDKDVSSDKAELKSQAGIPQEPNLATQTDSSQSKDGAADKKEQRKE